MGHLTFDSGLVNYLGRSDRLAPPRPWHPQGMPLHLMLRAFQNIVALLAGARIIHRPWILDFVIRRLTVTPGIMLSDEHYFCCWSQMIPKTQRGDQACQSHTH